MDAAIINVIKIKRFEVHFRVYGSLHTKNPPIVVVNGVGQSMASWRSFISHFKNEYCIVLFDFPGLGRSKILSGEFNLTLNEQSAILEAIVEKTCHNRVVNILASSWGGAVASFYAAQHSGCIHKLVLASFGLSANRNMISTIKRGQAAIETGRKHLCGEIIIESFGNNISGGLKNQIKTQFHRMNQSSILQFHEHISWSLDAELRSEIAFQNITARTLVINGRDDPIIDTDSMKYLEAVMPDCERKVEENVGHFLHLEDAAILDVYKAFFDDTGVCLSEHQLATAAI